MPRKEFLTIHQFCLREGFEYTCVSEAVNEKAVRSFVINGIRLIPLSQRERLREYAYHWQKTRFLKLVTKRFIAEP